MYSLDMLIQFEPTDFAGIRDFHLFISLCCSIHVGHYAGYAPLIGRSREIQGADQNFTGGLMIVPKLCIFVYLQIFFRQNDIFYPSHSCNDSLSKHWALSGQTSRVFLVRFVFNSPQIKFQMTKHKLYEILGKSSFSQQYMGS